MIMKKWIIWVAALSLALGSTGVATALALTGDGDGDDPNIPADIGGGIGDGAPGLPTYGEWLTEFGDSEVSSDVLTYEEWLALVTLVTTVTSGDNDGPVIEIVVVGEHQSVPGEEGDAEPLIVDGETTYEVQSYEEAVIQDCGLAGGTVYATSDGELGCTIADDVDGVGEGETQEQPPTIVPEPEVLPIAE